MPAAHRSSTGRLALTAASLSTFTLLIAGCASPAPAEEAGTPSAAPATASASPSSSAATPADVPVVPGYAPGEFPPVPLFLLPDLSLLDGSAPAFAIEASTAFQDIPGVRVTAAECDQDGTVLFGEDAVYLYGDGSGQYVGPDGVTHNHGDGSGTHVGDGVVIENNGDGSGSYVGNGVVIENNGDGSGSYTGNDLTIEIDGHGAGSYVGNGIVIENNGDGSGSYTGGGVVIENNGDGSGSYTGNGLVIENNGDGTGSVGITDIELEPLAPVPALGSFPPVDALAPVESCGTLITFDSSVLFDFGSSDVRADAAATLDTVAAALGAASVPRAVVSGHTDAIDTEEYNQQLSEERAASVLTALQDRGVTTPLTAEGHGESRPVAPNDIDGEDNPAGRQLNRRVEIFLPAA